MFAVGSLSVFLALRWTLLIVSNAMKDDVDDGMKMAQGLVGCLALLGLFPPLVISGIFFVLASLAFFQSLWLSR